MIFIFGYTSERKLINKYVIFYFVDYFYIHLKSMVFRRETNSVLNIKLPIGVYGDSSLL